MLADLISQVGVLDDSTPAGPASSSQASKADSLIPPGDFSKMINVIMLDERYNRSLLPPVVLSFLT